MGNGEIRFSFNGKNKAKHAKIPFRILVVGDFAAQSVAHSITHRDAIDKNEPQHPAQIPQSIDKYTLDTFFSTLNVNLSIEAPHYFAPDSNKQFFHFSPKSLNDFTPKGLLDAIPDLKRLSTLKTQIDNFPPGALSEEQLSGLIQTYRDIKPLQAVFSLFNNTEQTVVTSSPNSKTTATAIPAPASSASKTSDDAITRLLDMVATPNRNVATDTRDAVSDTLKQTRQNTFISNIVSTISHSGAKSKHNNALQKTALQYIDNILQTQINDLLHNKKVQAVESLWRGLKFLVDRSNFREAIEIHCLTTSHAELAINLKRLDVRASKVTYTVILSTFYVANTASELTALQTLTEYAEFSQTPFLFALDNGFLDTITDTVVQLNTNPVMWMNQPQYQQWNALRHKSCARWGVALYNRFLLRNEYEPGARQSAGISEQLISIDDALWGHPGFILLTLMTRSFEKTGWPTEIQGAANGEVEDLCLRQIASASGEVFSVPLEALLNIEQIQDLSTSGITALAGSTNSDRAYIYDVPCLWKSAKYSEERHTALSDAMNNLTYQLVVSLLARTVANQTIQLQQITNESTLIDEITQLLSETLSTSGDGVKVVVTVENNDDKMQQRVVFIQAKTGKYLLNGADIEFGLTI
ncbi:MAG: hypothetical protein GXP08_12175 [Gammaproteobacteria bacterium]|nr:hypothetical protein [Gammaproteobacteria bacterium]